jgi:hypothetical protein
MTTKLTLIAETINKQGVTTGTSAVTQQDTGDTWGPQMLLFMKLLKAQGFLFGIEAHIGVMDYADESFKAADDV